MMDGEKLLKNVINYILNQDVTNKHTSPKTYQTMKSPSRKFDK